MAAEKEYDYECPTCTSVFTIITKEEDKPVHCPFCAGGLDHSFFDDEDEDEDE